MTWRYQDILSKGNQTRKIDKIHKEFELHHVFIYNFLPPNISITPNHILSMRTKSNFTLSTNFYHFSHLSLKIASIPFFLSSDKH